MLRTWLRTWLSSYFLKNLACKRLVSFLTEIGMEKGDLSVASTLLRTDLNSFSVSSSLSSEMDSLSLSITKL